MKVETPTQAANSTTRPGFSQEKATVLVIACMLGFLSTIAAFFPGFMSADSINQLTQARSGQFSDWHPPLMALIWRYADFVVAGPFGMLFLQAFAWWLGLGMIVARLASQRWAPILVLLIGWWPPIFAMSGTIWKDVQLVSAFTLAIALILRAQASRMRLELVGAALLLFYGTAMRHNAVFTAIPLALWLAWLATAGLRARWPRLRLMLTGAIVGVLLVAPFVINARLTKVHLYPTQQLFAYDLLGMSVRSEEMLLPDSLQPEPLQLQDLGPMYSPISNAPMYWPPDNQWKHFPMFTDPAVVASLREAWLKTLLTHKKAYLQHRGELFLSQMGFKEGIYYPYHSGIDPNPLGVMRTPSKFSVFVQGRLDALNQSLLFRTWTYLLPLVACLGLTLRGALAGNKQAILAAVFASSGLSYAMPYFVVSGSSDLRYNLWTMVCALLGLIATVAFLRGRSRAPAAPLT